MIDESQSDSSIFHGNNNNDDHNLIRNSSPDITFGPPGDQNILHPVEPRRRGRPRLTEIERERRRQEGNRIQAQRNRDNRINFTEEGREIENLNSRSRMRNLRRSQDFLCGGGDFLSDDLPPHYCGKMDVTCTHCSAKHFQGEKVSNKGSSFHLCCQHGQVKLDPLLPYPSELLDLFKIKSFRDNIRLYNNIHSFAFLIPIL